MTPPPSHAPAIGRHSHLEGTLRRPPINRPERATEDGSDSTPKVRGRSE